MKRVQQKRKNMKIIGKHKPEVHVEAIFFHCPSSSLKHKINW